MANTEFEKFKRKLGKRIQEVRSSKGFTQESLAAAVSMDRVSIGYIEQGIRAPKLSSLVAICRALKVSLAEMFSALE